MDVLYFWLLDYKEFIFEQFYKRDLFLWFFFFMPFFVMGELPRYLGPAIVVYLLDVFNLPRRRPAREAQLLRSKPFISILVVGRNEEEAIENTIRSLLELEYEPKEIIVVDDCSSTEEMYNRCKPYADKGLIRLFRNDAQLGRGGRPFASNFAFKLARGEFVISVDADTSFDRGMIEEMITPFWNERIGAVAGNLKVRNLHKNIITDCQACEYLQSITLWKRFTSWLGTLIQASGAFGAFRRRVLRDVGAWDPELAEDADLSFKVKKLGYRLHFANRAIAMTNVPDTVGKLVRQRTRWDRGLVRTYYRKHRDIMDFRRFSPVNFIEMALEWVFSIGFAMLYLLYWIIMLIFFTRLLPFVLFVSFWGYVVLNFLILFFVISTSERRKDEWRLLWMCFLMPLYKGFLRWVRIYSYIMEYLRIGYELPYLPPSGYKFQPRW